MLHKKNIKTAIIVIVVILLGVVGYFTLIKKPIQITSDQNKPQTEPTQIEVPKYNNVEYGFSFSLPSSWEGYSVVISNWQGNMVDGSNKPSIKGPEILIRHPLWTSDSPRQDIPIMIFTLAQWDLILQEKLGVGAAPIGPSELGRNANYVFALPARYNFAYLNGFEEVQKILGNKPLKAF